MTESEPPFKPCAIYYPDADQTELILRDAGISWTPERSPGRAGLRYGDRGANCRAA